MSGGAEAVGLMGQLLPWILASLIEAMEDVDGNESSNFVELIIMLTAEVSGITGTWSFQDGAREPALRCSSYKDFHAS